MTHPTIHVDGRVVDFSHLLPVTKKVTLELKGGHRKVVPVEFNFSCHCYSRGLSSGEVAPLGHGIQDGSVKKPRPRTFDHQRYALSFKLVALIDQLILTNGVVTKSRHDNFFRVEMVEDNEVADPKSISYFLFFHARKVQEPNRPKSLLVWVESAYPEKEGIPHPDGLGSRTFGEMLGEKW